MELVGKISINPIIFFSGKLCGYFTWIILFIQLSGVEVFSPPTGKIYRDVSLIILAAGLAISVLSIVNLGRSTRLGLPTGNTEFKTGGLYKFSRNPMYLGFNLITLSSVIYFLNIIIILLGAFSIIVYHLIILGEEKFLKEKFGEQYLSYQKSVRRYF